MGKNTHGIYSKHFHVDFTFAIANIISIQGILIRSIKPVHVYKF